MFGPSREGAPHHHRSLKHTIATVAALLPIMVAALPAPADTQAQARPGFADPAFQRVWDQTDGPVATGQLAQPWMWGPGPDSTGLWEPWEGAPGGQRLVQYFDKTRMEITHPSENRNEQESLFYVTNGLLAREMITGQFQVGEHSYAEHYSADIPVTGDMDDPYAPTYTTLHKVMGPRQEDDPSYPSYLNIGGTYSRLMSPGSIDTTWDPQAHEYVADVFRDFIAQNPPTNFMAIGLPITPSFWAHVKIAGVYKNVLIQAFERRVLTYDPSNPEGWKVQMGNDGINYYNWRYHGAGHNTLETDCLTANCTTQLILDAGGNSPRIFLEYNKAHGLIKWSFDTTDGVLHLIQSADPATGETYRFSIGCTTDQAPEQDTVEIYDGDLPTDCHDRLPVLRIALEHYMNLFTRTGIRYITVMTGGAYSSQTGPLRQWQP